MCVKKICVCVFMVQRYDKYFHLTHLWLVKTGYKFVMTVFYTLLTDLQTIITALSLDYFIDSSYLCTIFIDTHANAKHQYSHSHPYLFPFPYN